MLHAAPYLWSGAGSVITRLIESQVERHDVSLITSPVAGELRNWPEYDSRVTRAGALRRRIDLFHRDSESLWTAVARMRRAIDDIKPDILHTHAGTPTAVAALARAASSRAAIPLVSHFYSWGLGRPEWMNGMDLWAFQQADAVVCSARAYYDVLSRGGIPARRLQLVPWGISAAGDARSNRTGVGTPVIGTLGRIERRKGQLDLVNVFARLRRRWPGATLEIVGPVAEPTYASEIHAAIQRHRLDEAVRLVGHVPDPSRYLRRWSVYVSLSSDEGQGLAVLEAMTNGVPVVALDVAGVEDYLAHNRTGLVARSRSAAGVPIERVLRNKRLASRLSASAATMVRRKYTWDRTVKSIETLYQRQRNAPQ